MAGAHSLLVLFVLVDEHRIVVTMYRAWLSNIFPCFAHSQHARPKPRAPHIETQQSVRHVFQPPLRLSMLRKIHCRTQLPLSATCLQQSHNCAVHEQSASLIDIRRGRYATASYNSNSSPQVTDSTVDISVASASNKTADKTWRLKIHDDLNKDGSRHHVMHKGDEESVRKRREAKRAKRSEEKKWKIIDKVSKANKRWQKYSNIDYELVLFISRYYDRLPLCPTCRSFFVTRQTHFLAENPRASIDYAADAALSSSKHKATTVKEAAKAKLIQDYDKQTSLIFQLCETCLSKCKEIREELKQISAARKAADRSNSPVVSGPPTPSQNATNYISDYHQMRLQELYQRSQQLIATHQHREQRQEDLASCMRQMQHHCLEMLHNQYPGMSLSFPYTPTPTLTDLTYRHEWSSDESSSSDHEEDGSSTDTDDRCVCECNRASPVMSDDDRLRIKTCHGLVEYCNAPLDDFIRGLQVLRCLGTFNHFPT